MRRIVLLILPLFLVVGCTNPNLENGLGSIPLPVSVSDLETEDPKGSAEEGSTRGVELLKAMEAISKDYKIVSINDDNGELTEPWWFTGGLTDTGFMLYGDRFTITIVESEVSGIFSAESMISEYIAALPEYKMITEEPIMSKTNSVWWTSFIVYTVDIDTKVAVSAEQYTLVQLVDRAYSIVVKLGSMDDSCKNAAIGALSKLKLPDVTYDDSIKKSADNLETTLTAEKLALYDATVIGGVNILIAIREYQDRPLAILVKTLKNSTSDVINYGARLGEAEGIRFDIKTTRIVGEFPDIRYLVSSLEPDALNYNADLFPLQNAGSDDYIDVETSFLSYLVYNTKEDTVIGIYLEQIPD